MATVHECVPFYTYLALFFAALIRCQCFEFNQEFTGVSFTPYVKFPFDNRTYPSKSSYTLKEIQVMLEIISDKFTNVYVDGSGSINDSYIWNVTYYNSLSGVYIAEIAARINYNRQSKCISVFQGIRVYDGPQIDTEVQLALECAEKANTIFPGTVEAIVFSSTYILVNDQADVVINYLQGLRQSLPESLKWGVEFNCNNITGNSTADDELLGVFTRIVNHSDFIICLLSADDVSMLNGPAKAFDEVRWYIDEIKNKMRVGTSTQLMGQVWWGSRGDNLWENVDNMKKYWEIAAEWACDNNFLMWFYEAFDRYKKPTGYYGWWKLIDNSKSEQRDGYVEKIHEGKEATNTGSTDVIVSIIAGLAIVVLLSAFIIFLLVVRMNKLEQKLSKEDIEEFLEGMKSGSNEADAPQMDQRTGDKYALKCPYDHSFEIAANHLNIQYSKILGTGQFGCVFKATINRSADEVEEVALKVAKPECPRMALKGLLSEIKILTYISLHRNIVKLVGAYTAELHRGIVYVATELCSLGSLQDHLRKQAKMMKYINIYENILKRYESSEYANIQITTFQQLLQWSQEIANGMEFLGSKNVVHADLASRNVLLTEGKTAKITDFGLSRRMYDYANYIKTDQEPLPWRWMSIESLKWYEFSGRSDVWSYGVTLWEIFTLGDTPYPGLTWTTDFVTKLVEGMRLGYPSHSTPELFDLMINCWHIQPKERPSFAEINQVVTEMIHKCKSRDSSQLPIR